MKRWFNPPEHRLSADKKYHATLQSKKGEVVISLYAKDCPVMVNNFVFLAREGFYDACRIFRVIEGDFVQMGDPTGIGKTGAGYKLADEPNALKLSHRRGTVSMANAGSHTTSSQFFICLSDDLSLDGRYNVIGQVDKGMDVVEQWLVDDVIDSIKIIET